MKFEGENHLPRGRLMSQKPPSPNAHYRQMVVRLNNLSIKNNHKECVTSLCLTRRKFIFMGGRFLCWRGKCSRAYWNMRRALWWGAQMTSDWGEKSACCLSRIETGALPPCERRRHSYIYKVFKANRSKSVRDGIYFEINIRASPWESQRRF